MPTTTPPAASRLALVADDEPDVRTLLTAFLRREGYDVLETSNGLEALELATTHQPDLTVLDVWMPLLSGFEVAHELRAAKATTDMAIMMLSADGTKVDVLTGLAAGADDYVVKPFSRQQLQLRLRDLAA